MEGLANIFNRAIDVGASYLTPAAKTAEVKPKPAPKVNYTPWIIGGVAAFALLIVVVLFTGRRTA